MTTIAMPDALRARLEARTKRYGAAPTQATARDVGTYAGCRLGDLVLGLPVAVVHEFAPLERWTHLKGHPHLLGVTQLRGEVMAFVDLLAALSGRMTGDAEWMAILQGRGGRAAVPVTEVLGTRMVTTADLLPAEQAPTVGPGVAATTSDLWFLLDPAAVGAALDMPDAPGASVASSGSRP